MLLDLPRIEMVNAVQTELQAGTEPRRYLEEAMAVLKDEIAPSRPSSSTRDTEEMLLEPLDLGEAPTRVVTGDANAGATRIGIGWA